MGAKLLTLFWVWLALGQSLYVSRGVVSASITTPLPDLYEASVIELQTGLTSGQFTSVDLIKVRKHAACHRSPAVILMVFHFDSTGVFRPHRRSQSARADASRCN